MQPFLVHDGREFYRLSLDRPGVYELPFAPSPYPCLVWDHGGAWSEGERDALVTSLIGTDCRYAVCGGVSCEQWHDDIDLTFVATVPEQEQDERFIMTTWHTGEQPLEVAWFFCWNTCFDEHDFRLFLVLEVGAPAGSSSIINAVSRAVTDSEAVVNELDRTAG